MKKNFRRLSVLAFMLVLPVVSFAQQGGVNLGGNDGQGGGNLSGNTTTTIINPIGAKTINDLIATILQGALRIGIPLLALAIIYSGFLFVAAQGKAEKLETAKKSLTYTIIGAAILLGAWALAQLITNTVIAL